MIKTVMPGERSGVISAPSSKSMAHRFLISAALSAQDSQIICPGISKDIRATMDCLNQICADIREDAGVINVKKVEILHSRRRLACGESGSTLRFLLPVAGALGMEGVFEMEGRLPERPMKEFEEVLCSNGMTMKRESSGLYFSGQLKPGEYRLPGNISSQYFSGLLFALPLLDGNSRIMIEGSLESADYFEMTKDVVRKSGIIWEEKDGMEIPGNQVYHSPDRITVEGDYSSAAFFLCAGAFSRDGIRVKNLCLDSKQADRRIIQILKQFGAEIEYETDAVKVSAGKRKGIDIDASEIPDLVPVLSAVAAVSEGETRIFHASRLRMKESDRLDSTAAMLHSLGAEIRQTRDGLIIEGKRTLPGGACTDSFNDHRIAMSAAVAACMCEKPVQIKQAQCVEKSYPDFWKDFESLKSMIGKGGEQ